jgi:hypothetical protein
VKPPWTMDESCSDDSEIEEERAGGGPGQPAEGSSRRTASGGGSGPTTSIRSAGGELTYRMTAETLCVRADIACVTYTCTCTVTTTRKWCRLFLDHWQSDFKDAVESQIQNANKRVSSIRCCIQALKSANVCCCFTSASRIDLLFTEQLRSQENIYPSHSLA